MNRIFNFAQSLFHLLEETGITHRKQGDYECNSRAEAKMSMVGVLQQAASSTGLLRKFPRCQQPTGGLELGLS